jgi:hypothetical protein
MTSSKRTRETDGGRRRSALLTAQASDAQEAEDGALPCTVISVSEATHPWGSGTPGRMKKMVEFKVLSVGCFGHGHIPD